MDTRSTILDRAMELFAARGYDGVGVQEVVEAAGVTKPTLYHYFGSKRGLLHVLLGAHLDALNAAIHEAALYSGDLPLTLRRVASSYVAFAKGNPVFYRMQLSMYFAPSHSDAFQEVAQLNRAQFSSLETLFLEASRDHGNMKGRHRLYAASFLGMINNCIGLSLGGFLTLDRAFVERAVHFFEHGIYS